MSVRLAVLLLGCLLTETFAAKHDVSTSVYHLRKLLEVGCSSGCEVATLPNDSGAYVETCRVELKTDLSCTELGSEPAEQPCQCCFVCRLNPDCQAWVHRTDTKKCYYKRASYDACKKVKCDTCVSSKPSAASFYTCTKRVTEETKWRKSEEASKPGRMASLAELKESAGDSEYGKGVLVGETSTPNICCFDQGFDQPAEFNLLEKPLILTNSYDCCYACKQNSMCKSWVWKKATFECFLKILYDESRNTIACPSCFAYKSSSSKYFYIEKKRSKGHAGEEKYTELVKTYSGVFHEGQTETSTGKSKTPSPSRPTYRIPSPSRSPYRSPPPTRPTYRSPPPSRPTYKSPSPSPKKTPYRSPSPSRSPYRSPSRSKTPKPSPSPSGVDDKYGELTLTVYQKVKADEKEGKQEATGKRGQASKKQDSGSTLQKKTYRCPYICNYDQPTEYDMFPQPFKFDRPDQCCQKYHETKGCKSWVYHKKTKKCHLKGEYHPEESKIPCADCIAYYEAKPSNAVPTT